MMLALILATVCVGEIPADRVCQTVAIPAAHRETGLPPTLSECQAGVGWALADRYVSRELPGWRVSSVSCGLAFHHDPAR